MIKRVIMAGFFTVLGAGCMLVPVAVSARSVGSHAAAHPPGNTAQALHHRFNRRPVYWGYYPYGSYGDESRAAPVMSAPAEKSVAETRRECEPKTYSVPTEAGGESKITVVRC